MRHLHSLVLIAPMLLQACGDDPSSNAPTPTQVQATTAKPEPLPPPEPELYVDAQEDLGTCDTQARGRLVYVTTDRAFFYCEATGVWSPLDLEGANGTQGDKGTDGAEGLKGDKGDPGTDGAEGLKGDPGQVATDSMWFDPIAERWWTFTTATTPFAVASQTCVGDWRLPTAEEFVIANARGLRVVATSNFEAWLQDGTHVRYDGQTLANAAAPYCIETLEP